MKVTVLASIFHTAFIAVANAQGPSVTICTAVNFGGTCVDIPVGAPTCVNLIGGLSFLNNQISSARVPQGFGCTFYDYFSCVGEPNDIHSIFLRGGSWPNFSNLPGLSGPVNFNDRTSSFQCGPIGNDDDDSL